MKNIHSLKNTLFIVGIFTSVIFSCTNCPKNEEVTLPTREEAIASIKEKIETAAEKWASGNPTGYADYAANDITWVDDLGAMFPISGKDSLKAYLESFTGQIPAHKHELSDMVFQFYEDMVIITYRYTGTFEGVPGDPWKVSSVFKYIENDWFSVHENWSEVKKK
jgi:hypothetical protein